MKKKKILIVDDNAKIRKILNFNLNVKGYEVCEACNGRQALELIEKDNINFDAIILDVMMPEMDGHELCFILKSKQAYEAIPIIMLTALDMTEDKIKSFEQGADVYITKPFKIEEILAQLKVLLRNIDLRKNANISILKKELEQKSIQLEKLNDKLNNMIQNVSEEKETIEDFDIFNNMGKLTYSIIHEFKNVLTAIMSRISCVDFYDTEEEKEIYLQTIIDICDNCAQVIESLLKLPNKDEVQKEKIDLGNLVEEIIFIFKGEFNLNKIKVFKEIQYDANVYINKYHIQQALINILINAKEALVNSVEKNIFIKVYQEEDYTYISIKDTGCGIEEEYLDKIFAPFFVIPKQTLQEKNTDKQKEIGLGLLLAKKLVQFNQGEISVKSKKEEYSEFIIKLLNNKIL